MFFNNIIRIVVVITLAGFTASAQTATPSRTRAHVKTLASEKLEGRMAGSAGERLAAEYIARELTRLGAKPLPGLKDFFQPFDFTAGTKDAGSTITVTRTGASPATYATTDHVQALSFSDNGEVSGPVVFAGYGLVVPDTQKFGYDSYVGLDVKDKIVLVLRYFPEDADLETRAILARYSDLRYKAMAARQRGAKAMLVMAGPRSPNAGATIPMTFDTALAGSGIVAASISGDAGRAIFAAAADKSLDDTQKSMDTGNPHASGFAIPNVAVTIKAAVQRETQTGRNVVAYLPATSPTTGVEKPWIALGAHYDHLGRGGHGNSLAGKEEAGRIHYGADDNELTVQATGSSPVWNRIIEQANVAAGFDLVLQPDPYQPTDVASFNGVGVPSLSFFTSTHTDYHRPGDTADKINYEDLDRVVSFAAAIVKRIGDTPEAPQFTKVQQQTDTAGRAGVRVFTGTIPDYATNVKGLLLGGVIGGGPAEAAGLQKGDVIVEIAGQSIANIYDYTYALELLKVGAPVKIVYMRGTERRETTLTPGARK
jgi:hypothetical protein